MVSWRILDYLVIGVYLIITAGPFYRRSAAKCLTLELLVKIQAWTVKAVSVTRCTTSGMVQLLLLGFMTRIASAQNELLRTPKDGALAGAYQHALIYRPWSLLQQRQQHNRRFLPWQQRFARMGCGVQLVIYHHVQRYISGLSGHIIHSGLEVYVTPNLHTAHLLLPAIALHSWQGSQKFSIPFW